MPKLKHIDLVTQTVNDIVLYYSFIFIYIHDGLMGRRVEGMIKDKLEYQVQNNGIFKITFIILSRSLY